MSNKYLALCLAGQLQSWSLTPRICNRSFITTNEYPTKSGIVGLLCAAKGIKKDDTVNIKKLAELKQTILILKSGSILIDFHTIGGGHDPEEAENLLYNSIGAIRKDPIVTNRSYLEDAAFGVIIEGESSVISNIETALRNPKWLLYLGRKSCTPACPILIGVFDNKEDAKKAATVYNGVTYPNPTTIEDVSSIDESNVQIKDYPISFSSVEYTYRYVKRT